MKMMDVHGLKFENTEEVDYVNIPIEMIGKDVLEVGVSNRIFNTHLWDKISQGSYTGIDIINRVKHIKGIRVIEADIRTYEFNETFDTIISVHTLEHIDLWDWKLIFDKLKSVLNPGGKIIINVPHNEKSRGYSNFPKCLTDWDRHQQHVVFGITKEMLHYFLPGCFVYRKTKFFWRQDGCSLIWAIGRFIKRLFIGDFSPIRRNIYAVWEKT